MAEAGAEQRALRVLKVLYWGALVPQAIFLYFLSALSLSFRVVTCTSSRVGSREAFTHTISNSGSMALPEASLWFPPVWSHRPQTP